jgi:peptidoglycan/LPS O-acetylase OafA/YrhL
VSSMLPSIPRQNNIGALRLIFACVVMFHHIGALSDIPVLVPLSLLNAPFAVKAFFVLSGFLIVMSYEHSKNADDYFGKRIRRIYPAYAAVVLACAFGGYFLSDAPNYFNDAWLRYVASNLVFLNFHAPTLPGVFTQNPLKEVNGALWTIKIEVMFYALVPVLVWLLRGPRRLPMIAAIFIGACVYRWAFAYSKWGIQLPGQMMYFISGVAFYYYFDWLKSHQAAVAAASLFIVIASLFFVSSLPVAIILTALSAVAIAGLVILLAFGTYWGDVEKHGDFSYGIYIWHFPVIQTLIVLGAFANPYVGMLTAVSVTVLLAFASWRLVEKPALRASSHYIRASF